MFEISDDDDKFWESLPLDDISNLKPAPIIRSTSGSLKRVLVAKDDSPNTKRQCSQFDNIHPGNNHPSLSTGNTNDHSKTVNDLMRNPEDKQLTQTTSNGSIRSHGLHNDLINPNERLPNHKSNVEPFCNISDSLRSGHAITFTTPNKIQACLNESRQGVLSSSDMPTATPTKLSPEVDGRDRFSVGTSSIGVSTRSDYNSINGSGLSTPTEKGYQSDRDIVTPKVCKRKFPGPAGLLPKLQAGQMLATMNLPCSLQRTSPDQNQDDVVVLSSQSSDDVFTDEPWRRLLNDLPECDYDILRTFSVSNIMQKASRRLLPEGKVVLMFAVLETVEKQNLDASVTLMDKSGKITGTIHREVMKECEASILPGTCLILKQMSVVSPTNRTHYLNITGKNIVQIYTVSETRSCDQIQLFRSQLKEIVCVARQHMLQPVVNTPVRVAPETDGRSQNFRSPSVAHTTPRLSSTFESYCHRSVTPTTSGHFPASQNHVTAQPSTQVCRDQTPNSHIQTPNRTFNFKHVNSAGSPASTASPRLAGGATPRLAGGATPRLAGGVSHRLAGGASFRNTGINPRLSGPMNQTFSGCESSGTNSRLFNPADQHVVKHSIGTNQNVDGDTNQKLVGSQVTRVDLADRTNQQYSGSAQSVGANGISVARLSTPDRISVSRPSISTDRTSDTGPSTSVDRISLTGPSTSVSISRPSTPDRILTSADRISITKPTSTPAIQGVSSSVFPQLHSLCSTSNADKLSKSKVIVEAVNSTVRPSINTGRCGQNLPGTRTETPEEDMWQDDLSDDLISQMSEELF